MPALTSDEKRDALAKSMGAAFLASQVEQLEKSVESIHFSRDKRLYNNSNQHHSNSPSSANRATNPAMRRARRVLDVSVLVHCLPLIKRWIREDSYHLIVPLEVISTLDILKRAPPPLNDLAQEATRFLLTQLDIARQITTPAGVIDDQRVRLRAQFGLEEIGWTEVERRFVIPEGFIVLAPSSVAPSMGREEEGQVTEAMLPTANDVPKSIRSTLQCALHFQSLPSPAPSCTLLLFEDECYVPPIPSGATSTETVPTRLNGSTSLPTTDFYQLSLGNPFIMVQTFITSLNITKVRAAEVEAARDWMRALGAAKAKSTRGSEGQNNRGSTKKNGGGIDNRKRPVRTGSLFVP